MKVLLIEDDPTITAATKLMLAAEGFIVSSTCLGEEGLDLGRQLHYDVILLDLLLPDMHGYDVLKKLRSAQIHTPIIILSGVLESSSKIRAFGFGADDYLDKPFHRQELLARIYAVVRRSQSRLPSVIHIGKLTINLSSKTAHFDGSSLPLTGTEYAILELLSLRKGITLSNQAFVHYIYDGRDEPGSKIINVFICKLRKKLAKYCDGLEMIKTVWGGGYKIIEPEMTSLTG